MRVPSLVDNPQTGKLPREPTRPLSVTTRVAAKATRLRRGCCADAGAEKCRGGPLPIAPEKRYMATGLIGAY